MKAYIWDLDGTLIDSYEGILDSLMDVLNHFGIRMNRNEVYEYIIKKSVHELLSFIAEKNGLNPSLVSDLYTHARKTTMMKVSLMDGAEETLKALSISGMNFIFTHKGNAAYDILKSLEVREYVKDIITAEDGFPMKPDASAIIYLMDKYKIKKEDACYIGDRPLDIECADNAGIRGILYKNEKSPITMDGKCIIHDLRELIKMEF